MHQSTLITLLATACLTIGCTHHSAPDISLHQQPISILSGNGYGQTFTYAPNGRLQQWCESYDANSNIKAIYTYPDAETIEIHTIYNTGSDSQIFNEQLSVVNGKVTYVNGTWEVVSLAGYRIIAKTYCLHVTYDEKNRPVAVKHSEVMGIGDEINETAWNKSWEWSNTLTWDGYMLKEFVDYNGQSAPTAVTHYDYSTIQSPTPMVVPNFLFRQHAPLQMQGLFGANPACLISKTVNTTRVSPSGNEDIRRTEYDYEITDNRVSRYSKVITFADDRCIIDTYNVDWLCL